MSIRTSKDFRSDLTRLKWLQDIWQWDVKKLPPELPELNIICMGLISWWHHNKFSRCNTQWWKDHNKLFGIDRKPTRTRPDPCARLILLWMLPIEAYRGQYSMWPVATETVVLSLPRTMGTNKAPCVEGSSEIISLIRTYLSHGAHQQINVHLLLFPSPISGHKVFISANTLIVILPKWCVVKGTMEVLICQHVLEK